MTCIVFHHGYLLADRLHVLRIVDNDIITMKDKLIISTDNDFAYAVSGYSKFDNSNDELFQINLKKAFVQAVKERTSFEKALLMCYKLHYPDSYALFITSNHAYYLNAADSISQEIPEGKACQLGTGAELYMALELLEAIPKENVISSFETCTKYDSLSSNEYKYTQQKDLKPLRIKL